MIYIPRSSSETERKLETLFYIHSFVYLLSSRKKIVGSSYYKFSTVLFFFLRVFWLNSLCWSIALDKYARQSLGDGNIEGSPASPNCLVSFMIFVRTLSLLKRSYLYK